MMPKREFTHYRFVFNKGWLNIHFSPCDTSKVMLEEAVFSAYSPSEVQWYTRSPFVPCLPWLALSVGETSYGIRMGFVGSTNSLHYLFMYLKCNFWTCSVNQIIIIFSQQKRKQPSLSSRNNNLCFYWLTTLYTTSLTQLCYSTASVSHPIPLSAANLYSV